MTEQSDAPEVRRRRATNVAATALLVGVATALAGAATWHVGSEGQLLLVAAIINGLTLAPLLWLVTGLCAVVLGVTGFRLFVIGYEPFTAAMAAIFLCAVIVAACVGTLIMGLLTLLPADLRYTTLHELDRPYGNQIVIEDTGTSSGPTWRFYVGGPFIFDEIPESAWTTAKCAKLSTAERTTFEGGEYLLTTDERGRDVITFTTDSLRLCDDTGVSELVLPE